MNTEGSNNSDQVNKSKSAASNTRSTLQSLITLERAQKLDLLIHLISNLNQSLVLCGPEGIGKTTLLKVLQEQKSDVWVICNLLANKRLSYEQIQKDLLQALQKNDSSLKSRVLDELIAHYRKQNQKIILIIDDAGQLVPGLITTLCQFAKLNNNLRIVFSLTPNEVHIKNSSDKSLQDCHFIDIPPLTEQQCGEFLQNLSTKPGSAISLKAINAAMVDKIYRETHGIPGTLMKIQDQGFSRLNGAKKIKWITTLVLLLILGGGYFFRDDMNSFRIIDTEQAIVRNTQQLEIFPPARPEHTDLFQSHSFSANTSSIDVQEIAKDDSIIDENGKKLLPIKPVVVVENKSEGEKKEPPTVDVDVDVDVDEKVSEQLIVRQTNKLALDKAEDLIVSPNLNPVKKIPDLPVATTANVAQQQIKPQPQPVSIESPKIEKKPEQRPVTIQDDSQWVIDQPPKNYTLQLMVLAKKEPLIKLKNKYRDLEKDLYIYKRLKNRQENYILVWGSFSSLDLVKKSKKTLPTEFKNSWIRRMRALQKELKSKP